MADSSRGPAFYLCVGVVLGVVLTLSGGLAVQHWTQPSAPRPSPSARPLSLAASPSLPAPTPTPEPDPPVVEEVVEVRAETPPPPLASAAPRRPRATPAKPAPAPPPPGSEVLLGQAQTALADQRFEAAASLFDEILKSEPSNATARKGRVTAQAAAAALRRAFVPGVTSAESGKRSAGKKMKGFDSGEVEVRPAAEVPGRIEFEVRPERIKPGDRLTVRVFLFNLGKKDIKINALNMSRAVNDTLVAGSLTPREREVQPMGRALLDVLEDVWAPETASWALEVNVSSQRGDNYQNRLSWK